MHEKRQEDLNMTVHLFVFFKLGNFKEDKYPGLKGDGYPGVPAIFKKRIAIWCCLRPSRCPLPCPGR